MTIDEIVAETEEIARNGEGADKFRALKMLHGMQSSQVTVPDLLEELAVVDKLAVLMSSQGATICQQAYNRAFSRQNTAITDTPKFKDTIKTIDVDVDKLPTNLKQMYRMFPEAKRHGYPRGYPAGRGFLVQKEWIQKYCVKLLRDREQGKFDDQINGQDTARMEEAGSVPPVGQSDSTGPAEGRLPT